MNLHQDGGIVLQGTAQNNRLTKHKETISLSLFRSISLPVPGAESMEDLVNERYQRHTCIRPNYPQSRRSGRRRNLKQHGKKSAENGIHTKRHLLKKHPSLTARCPLACPESLYRVSKLSRIDHAIEIANCLMGGKKGGEGRETRKYRILFRKVSVPPCASSGRGVGQTSTTTTFILSLVSLKSPCFFPAQS